MGEIVKFKRIFLSYTLQGSCGILILLKKESVNLRCLNALWIKFIWEKTTLEEKTLASHQRISEWMSENKVFIIFIILLYFLLNLNWPISSSTMMVKRFLLLTWPGDTVLQTWLSIGSGGLIIWSFSRLEKLNCPSQAEIGARENRKVGISYKSK